MRSPGAAPVAPEDPSRRAPSDPLRAVGEARFRRSRTVPAAFFEDHAAEVSLACLAMARRFARGGRLLAFGAGPAGASDADHVAVEFVHPVIVGKRALPALAIEGDFAARVRALAAPDDVAMGIDPGGDDPAVVAALDAAAGSGLLTLSLSGPRSPSIARPADHAFVVDDADPLVVQETLETLYHVLWELVHVFFEHEEVL